MATASADIGLVGLAVMGENLVLNMASKGFTVAVFNRTTSKVDDFVQGRAAGKTIIGCQSMQELVNSLQAPRKVMLMVKAGNVVDIFIDQLVPLLSKGDVIIDGGNSHFPDTNRRCQQLGEKGILYVGAGVSGGEEGALTGPSMMPGGHDEAWPHVKPIFQAICAKVTDGTPCCDWVGQQGAGHYVKMVHNGIEYGDMQITAEASFLLKYVAKMGNEEIANCFAEWNKGELDSYLIEITAEIFRKKDDKGDGYLIDKILDAAGQKGTGKWTAINALDQGQPVTLIGEAVFARCLSALVDERKAASAKITGPESTPEVPSTFVEDVRQAVLAAKIISYAQGFMLMASAAKDYGWKLNFGAVALMWRGGCIIRSTFLGRIKEAYDRNPELPNLLLDSYFGELVQRCQASWRRVAATGIMAGVAMPAITSALAFFDGFRSERTSANLIQAQRDFFGAHTYERVDGARGEWHHCNWTGRGGSTSSSTYNA